MIGYGEGEIEKMGTVNSFAQISLDILAEVGTVNSFAQISLDILAEV